MIRRNGNTLFFSGSALTLVAAFAGLTILADRMDQSGQRYFDTGAEIVTTLDQLARAYSGHDMAKASVLYSDRFRGSPLSLTRLESIEEKDGLRRFRFVAGASALDRAGAMAEWRAYLDSFEAVEEIKLHLHRLEAWDLPGPLVAQVRLELIGKPKGALQTGIDRAFFRFEFESLDGQLRILSSSLQEGERTIADRPQFVNVAREAGVDFLNQYYPAFLNQPLKFGMIRYGPAGITAADYDNDGSYDLFIPDGVESRLFRNRRDGTFEEVTAKAGLSGLDGVS